MPIAKIRHLLPNDLIPSVMARQVEMSIPIIERTYCVSCSAFLPHDSTQEGTAVCHKCRTSTCTTCKEKAHSGSCHNNVDQGLKKFEALAKKEGWQKCSKCLMMVQKHVGCNHMT
jgi:methionyl-tRNA synthetase